MKNFIKLILKKTGGYDFAKSLLLKYLSLRGRFLLLMFPFGKYVKCNGASVYVDFRSPNYAWYFGENHFLRLEHAVFSALFEMRSPDVVIDVGAHWGVFPSACFNGRWRGVINRMVCIEPDKDNIPILKKTISKIGLSKVDVVECAVGDKDLMVSAYRDGGQCMQTYPSSNAAIPAERVAMRRLTSVLSELSIDYSRVTHIKLDIDGFEPAFFAGAEEFLRKYKPLLLVEFWAKGIIRSGYDLEKYWEYLVDNYLVYEISYPEGRRIRRSKTDFQSMVDGTMNGVKNLVLLPQELDASDLEKFMNER